MTVKRREATRRCRVAAEATFPLRLGSPEGALKRPLAGSGAEPQRQTHFPCACANFITQNVSLKVMFFGELFQVIRKLTLFLLQISLFFFCKTQRYDQFQSSCALQWWQC